MEKVIQLTDSQVVLMQEAITMKEQAQANVNLLGLAFIAGSDLDESEGSFNFDLKSKTLTLTSPDEPKDPAGETPEDV